MVNANDNVKEIMRRAFEKGIIIPAFNVAYLPMLEPIVESLKELKAFGLVQVARPDVEKFGAKSIRAVAEEYSRLADPRCMRLHLDHTPVIDEDGARVDWKPLIRDALKLGYHSVMVDGSRLPFEENVAATRETVEMAKPYGAAVEAELGAVLGHEKGPLPPYEQLFRTGKGFTRPEDAKRFVQETGVDWLSVAVGNIHGAISGAAKDKAKVEARLNIEHLKKLAKAANVPLVLHGGSGINQQCVLDGIKAGIAKINIGTNVRQPYEKALTERPNDTAYACFKVAEEMRHFIVDYFHIAGSAERL
jgi:ketose-bisphosphate aldolase